MTKTQICLIVWSNGVQSHWHTQTGQSKRQCSAFSEIKAHYTLAGRCTGDSAAQPLRTQELEWSSFNQLFLDVEVGFTYRLVMVDLSPPAAQWEESIHF